MDTKKLITVTKFAASYPSVKNGIGVNAGYIYKLLKTKTEKELGFKLVQIDGRNFILPIE